MTGPMITTDAALQKLKPPATGRLEIRDKIVPGLYLRVSAAGKVWYLRGRPPGEKNPVAMKMAPYGTGTDALTIREARLKAEAWKEAIRAGDDPRDEGRQRRQRADDTFNAVVDRFLKTYAFKIKKNTLTQYKSILEGKDVAEIRNKPITKITATHINEVVDDIVSSGRLTQANRTLAVLRKFFNWCAEKHIIKESEPIPTQRVKPPVKEKPRNRVLSPDELRIVWQAADRLGWPFGSHIQLLIATGQRQSEAAAIARPAVSRAVWRQVDNKADREHLVPLNSFARAILKAVPEIPETGHYFLSTNGTSPISGFSKAKSRLDKEIRKICEEDDLPLFVEPWRTHDLRRTFTTRLRELGVSQEVCSRILNHSAKGVTGRVYDLHDLMDEKRQAMKIWDNYLDRLINGRPANVVPLKNSPPGG